MTYMNSDADLKAFCGENGGIVCTSSNAVAAYRWAFERGDKILFFPDEHLGRNTANAMGIPKARQRDWDWRKPMGGLSAKDVEEARVLLWKGFCHVHQWFTPEHIAEVRNQYPGAKVVVHPECTEEVVAEADAVGSTNFIADFVEKAGPGSVTAVGTEVQMVSRLAFQHSDRTVLPLSRSLCPNMYRINLSNLAYATENLEEVREVTLPADVSAKARVALQRMLEVH
jgi:quinolinate synthase